MGRTGRNPIFVCLFVWDKCPCSLNQSQTHCAAKTSLSLSHLLRVPWLTRYGTLANDVIFPVVVLRIDGYHKVGKSRLSTNAILQQESSQAWEKPLRWWHGSACISKGEPTGSLRGMEIKLERDSAVQTKNCQSFSTKWSRNWELPRAKRWELKKEMSERHVSQTDTWSSLKGNKRKISLAMVINSTFLSVSQSRQKQ